MSTSCSNELGLGLLGFAGEVEVVAFLGQKLIVRSYGFSVKGVEFRD